MANKQANTYRNAKRVQNESPIILKHLQRATGWPISKLTHSDTQKECSVNNKKPINMHSERQDDQ